MSGEASRDAQQVNKEANSVPVVVNDKNGDRKVIDGESL